MAASVPHSIASGFALGMFAFCSQTIMALLAGDAVPAFNLFAIFRLNDDVAFLTQLADSLPYPNLPVRPCPHGTVHPGMSSGIPCSCFALTTLPLEASLPCVSNM